MKGDFPYDAVVTQAEALIRDGATVFQKFTCQKCGKRLTLDVPNIFLERGQCEVCGGVTDIRRTGCNFLVIHATPSPRRAASN